MNTAQQIADAAQHDFGAAVRAAVAQGHRGSVWFAGCEYAFPDGSVLTLRAGRIESPLPTNAVWTEAQRVAFDV